MQLAGKNGVILGLANTRSIAWSIAQAANAAGAKLAFNYQGERLAEGVRAMSDQLGGVLCEPCDLSDDAQIDTFFAKVSEVFGGKLDFMVHCVAYAKSEELSGRFSDTSRAGFSLAMDISAYTLVATAKRALPLMQAAGGGSISTLSYYGAEKVVKNYNVMGVAKAALEASVRYLAADLGPDNIRVNAISAGPIKTLAARGIGNFSEMLKIAADRAPLKRNTDPDEVGQTAVFLASDGGRGITGETLYVDAGYNIMGL